jgi:hypothetical protein
MLVGEGTLAEASMMTNLGETMEPPGTEGFETLQADAGFPMAECANGAGMTWDDLYARVQASRVELEEALAHIGAMRIGGRWTLIEDNYERYVMDLVMATCVINDWPLSAVPVDNCAAEVGGGVLPAVAAHVIRSFAADRHRDASGGAEDAQQQQQQQQPELSQQQAAESQSPERSQRATVALDATKVCRFRALEILLGGETSAASAAAAGEPSRPRLPVAWPLDEFFRAWREACPDEFTPDPTMLRGAALIDTETPGGVVVPLPVSRMDADPRTRFQELFRLRSVWALPDLEAYTRDLVVPGLTYDQVLLKYAREITYSVAGPREGAVPRDERKFCLRVVS